MDFSTTGHKLTIYLSGSIDSANSQNAERAIKEIREANPDLPLFFDVGRLEYVSNDGLSVLMKFKDENDEKLDIINASNNLYEFFNVGDFRGRFNIRRKPRLLSVNGLETAAKSRTIRLYKIDGDFWLKVNLEKNLLDNIDTENVIARSAFINGIPTEIAYETVTTEDGCGQLYELPESCMLSEALRSHPDKVIYYTKGFAGFMKDVHGTEIDDPDMPETKKELLKALVRAKAFFSEGDFTAMRDFLESVPDRRTFLYGDFDTEGIMLKYGAPFFVDFANAGVGHPIFDLADIYITYCISEDMKQQINLNGSWFDGTGFSDDVRENLFRTFIYDYFACVDNVRRKRMELIKGMAYLKMILSPALRGKNVTEEIMKPQRRFARMYLMNDIYDMIGKIDF